LNLDLRKGIIKLDIMTEDTPKSKLMKHFKQMSNIDCQTEQGVNDKPIKEPQEP